MPFVTPRDMQEMYDAALLVQATNYADRSASGVNAPVLLNACNHGDRIVSGYLLPLGVPEDAWKPDFRKVLKTHAGRLAFDFLAGTDPQVRELAQESIKWLEGLMKLTPAQVSNLIEPEQREDLDGAGTVIPVVNFSGGSNWSVLL